MVTQNTTTGAATAARHIQLNQPQANQQIVIDNIAGAALDMAFPSEAAQLEQSGQDLVFLFENGGRIVLSNFFGLFESHQLPAFNLEDGQSLPGDAFLAALREDLLPAAGPGAGAAAGSGGVGDYTDDAGNLIGGVDRLDPLGTTTFGVQALPGIEDAATPLIDTVPTLVLTTGAFTVFESDLDFEGYRNDGSATYQDTDSGRTIVTGSFAITAPDGIGSLTVGSSTFTAAQLAALQAGGSPLVVNLGAQDAYADMVLTGFDGTNITFRYTLTGSSDHFAPNGEDRNESIPVTITDSDGDSASGTIVVTIADDAPLIGKVDSEEGRDDYSWLHANGKVMPLHESPYDHDHGNDNERGGGSQHEFWTKFDLTSHNAGEWLDNGVIADLRVNGGTPYFSKNGLGVTYDGNAVPGDSPDRENELGYRDDKMFHEQEGVVFKLDGVADAFKLEAGAFYGNEARPDGELGKVLFFLGDELVASKRLEADDWGDSFSFAKLPFFDRVVVIGLDYSHTTTGDNSDFYIKNVGFHMVSEIGVGHGDLDFTYGADGMGAFDLSWAGLTDSSGTPEATPAALVAEEGPSSEPSGIWTLDGQQVVVESDGTGRLVGYIMSESSDDAARSSESSSNIAFILQVHPVTGYWTFTQKVPLDLPDSAHGKLTFNYTITDGDGDTASSSFTVKIIEAERAPDIDMPTEAHVVHESGLFKLGAIGSELFDHDANTMVTGSFVIDMQHEGFQSVTVGGKSFDNLADLKAEGWLLIGDNGKVVGLGDDPHAKLKITDVFHDETTDKYTVSYKYVLIDNVDHNYPDGTETGDVIPITVTDATGDHAFASLTITIVDDVPKVVLYAWDDSRKILTTQDSETIDTRENCKPVSVSDSVEMDFSHEFIAVPRYGADGPGSVSMSYALTIMGNPGQYGRVESGLTHDDHKIYLYEIDGVVYGSTSSSGSEHSVLDGKVFSVSVDVDGHVTLTQYTAIDHAEQGVDYKSLGNQLIGLVGTATVTDGDGDSASASKTIDLGGNIRFEDDMPAVSVSLTNATLHPLITQDAETMGYDGKRGHHEGEDSSEQSFSAAFKVEIDWGADGAADHNAKTTDYTLDITKLAGEGGLVDSGLSHDGQHIYLFKVADGSIVGSTALSAGGITDGNTVFSVSVKDTGQVKLTQYSEIDHEGAGKDIASLDDGIVRLNVSVTVKDGDGDRVEAHNSVDISGNIRFEDDIPTLSVSLEHCWNKPLTTYDKDTIGDGVSTSFASFAGAFDVEKSFGADGAGSYGIKYSLDLKSSDGLVDSKLDHDGKSIYLYEVGGKIVGSTSTESDIAGGKVFDISVDSSTGVVTLTQYSEIDHDAPSRRYDTDDVKALASNLVNLVATATVMDGDGDTVEKSARLDLGGDIKFVDDVPKAYDNANSVTEDSGTGPIEAKGNLIVDAQPQADTVGADGNGHITAISFGANAGHAAAGGGWDVDGKYGTLHVNADGTYTYTLHNNATVVQALSSSDHPTETFTYTLADGDGDTSQAHLTVTVNGADEPRILSIGEVPEGHVYEADLAGGSGWPDNGLISDGQFTITSSSGLTGLKIGTGTVNLALPDGAHQDISTDHGKLTITDVNHVGDAYTVKYTYTLTQTATNPDADHNGVNEDFKETLQIKATDSTGTATHDLVVSIVDDHPTAVADVKDYSGGMTTTVLIVLDSSGSMGPDRGLGGGDPDGPGGYETKFELAKACIDTLLAAYKDLGAVNVRIVDFDDDTRTSDWFTGSSAKTDAMGWVNTDANSSVGGGTRYTTALDAATGALMNGVPPADRSVVYFLSDGAPNDGYALGSTKAAAWDAFLKNLTPVDTVYAYGMATTGNITQLERVAWDRDGQPVTDPAKEISNLVELKAELLATVPVTGTLFANDNAGADGGAGTGGSLKLYSFEGHLASPADVDGKYTVDLGGNKGKVTVDFDDGTYTYVPGSNPVGSVELDYQIKDGDGSIASSTLTLNLRAAELWAHDNHAAALPGTSTVTTETFDTGNHGWSTNDDDYGDVSRQNVGGGDRELMLQLEYGGGAAVTSSRTFDVVAGDTLGFDWRAVPFQQGSYPLNEHDDDRFEVVIEGPGGTKTYTPFTCPVDGTGASGKFAYLFTIAGTYTVRLKVVDGTGIDNGGYTRVFVDDVVFSHAAAGAALMGNVVTDHAGTDYVDQIGGQTALITEVNGFAIANDGQFHTVVGDYGTITINAFGQYAYHANSGTNGHEDAFVYKLTGGTDSDYATLNVHIGDTGTHLSASPEAWDVHSSSSGHFHLGGTGNDTLTGGGGNDVIFGNYGNDIIHGNAGHDTLHGGAGNDTLYGDAGNDILVGGQGSDTLYGDDADHTVHGADTFMWNAEDFTKDAVDTVKDFNPGEGDVLRFADILLDNDAGTAGIQLDIAQVGTNAVLKLHHGASDVQTVVLENVINADTTLHDIEQHILNHKIITENS
ncbi:DUF5801 repeats-in-toxin domain-containing protein [Nitratidesulfovibrio sp. SRB-5]|uniref:DUF5801 repeats-in-toxin domain-containing protein n=1 Tax=Nitratidesulfovibrio sp. SRB-5 TaxID=2872636 RepID=UPI00102830FF|nr:DUF5801 repeats-in-toxin domain-containing protein [Nitratidesulfovibrio sp. SRB-5]MBZ2172350.1 DUF5801 domain-containing protein [Nitratidesulfovibrio sp. SRB-5]RXF76258.1 VWA domain-containing protein [Desulfovibrio sp. DS-1]